VKKLLTPQGLKTYSLRTRKSKVSTSRFAKPLPGSATIAEFLDSLPGFLAGRDFREFLALAARARHHGRPILFACGAHVIKVGLQPVLIDLMERGFVQGLALNGAGIIHDFEIAFAGRTSEDVAGEIVAGRFGAARETGEFLNRAIVDGVKDGLGLGAAVGRMIAGAAFPHKNLSLLAAGHRLGIPVTVHVALGTDIIHFHPSADGAAIGEGSLRDFFTFASLVGGLEGGVHINVGSAVLLPEVFLKAVAFVRNKGIRLERFTTAVFDFMLQYRPDQNVVRRPVGEKGRGFYFVGPHEIMIPLLAAGLKIQDP
jgi:hypothetical protein